ncbi:hypothetical protein IWW50_003989 [Coemansia erecta]|nr:hypothetical protein GGF43_004111 [Coemansia sp. RSA 2618]KAJ2822966.1 hypothetical protein IWW50_003989 [Coemansia erecta]
MADRVYELETTVSQLRAANTQTQRTAERLERERQRTQDELDTLHKTHERLEARFFAAEAELAAAAAQAERMQRSSAARETGVEQRSAALEREREAWQRTEAELRAELAAVRRRAAVGRRQTVSAAASPPMHSRTKSMYAHDAGVLERDADSGADAQTQIRQLTRRLREADARARDAAAQAHRVHEEAGQALADLDASQRRTSKLEHTVAQLSELNESLREDNESYQVLLQMSTIKGGMSFGNGRPSIDSRASSGKWAASPTILEDGSPAVPDLAAELGRADGLGLAELGSPSSASDSGSLQARMGDLEEQITQLKEELRKTKYERRHLGEENKALGLYVNKILGRILTSSGGLEAVLSHDFDPAKKPAANNKPPPPRPSHSRHSSLYLVRKSPPREQPPPPSLALFAEPGSGDGITSVFVPPSPATLPRNLAPPGTSALPNAVEPPISRRARSATVAAGAISRPAAAEDGSGTASVGAASGTWWKRVSMRFGSGAGDEAV